MFASYEFDYLADLRADYGDARVGSPALAHLFVNQNTANWFLGAGTLRNEVGGIVLVENHIIRIHNCFLSSYLKYCVSI